MSVSRGVKKRIMMLFDNNYIGWYETKSMTYFSDTWDDQKWEEWCNEVAPNLHDKCKPFLLQTLKNAFSSLDETSKSALFNTLKNLSRPTEPTLNWLTRIAKGRSDGERLTLPSDVDLSNILICHPVTGASIRWYKGSFDAVNFSSSVFLGDACFQQRIFEGTVNFAGAIFVGDAKFDRVKFNDRACFIEANFLGNASFIEANFTDVAQFERTIFNKDADFQAVFTKQALFNRVNFRGETNFAGTEFLAITSFEEATFTAAATFHTARFGKTVSFRRSEWGAVPDFKGTAWKDGVAVDDFEQLQTDLNTGTIDLRQQSTSDPASLPDRLQALRKMARDADDRPRELDYFALELQARYQGKGLGACLVSLYRRLSDYGRGVGRPLGWLAGLWGLFALLYGVLADGDGSVLSQDRLFALTYGVLLDVDWSLWGHAILLSLVNALPTVGAGSAARESSVAALYGSNISDVPSLVHGIAVIEGVIGFILLFLIALGLRNRFRL